MFKEHSTEEIMNFIFGDEVKEEIEMPQRKEESKENIIEFKIELVNYDETIEKLGSIKHLMNELSKDDKEVKSPEILIKQAIEDETTRSSIEVTSDRTMTCSVEKKDNHTLEELRQKLINDLYNQKGYDSNEIEIMRMLFGISNKQNIKPLKVELDKGIYLIDYDNKSVKRIA